MGAGKSTLGPALADRLRRSFVSVDALVEERAGSSVPELFERAGERRFREFEEGAALDALTRTPAAVIELGGGAVRSPRIRAALEGHAFSLLLETTAEEAWARVRGSGRPLARDGDAFEALLAERRPLYEAVADGRARDLDGAVLAAAGVHAASGSVHELVTLVPAAAQVDLVADEAVANVHGETVRRALGSRLATTHLVTAGEHAKSVEQADRLWRALRLERDGLLVALGGGSTTDLSGFVAATYLRGLPWVALPTTLVGQVDAAIGGKTAIDLPEGKNLVGAFHWPARTVLDPDLLATLPPREHANGLAEIVKTGLLAGEAPWELSLEEQVRRCAAFKAAVCLRDPEEQGERAQLNLGHTFAHALETASGYTLPHGRAVALGLLAALRLSDLADAAATVTEVLAPEPAPVALDAVWAALVRDKKARAGTPRFVLLDAVGEPRWGVEVPEADARAAVASVVSG